MTLPVGSLGGRNGLDLDAVVIGRKESLFSSDIAAGRRAISEAIRARRVLIVGGGGSVGSMMTALVLDERPAAIHVVDVSENYLADLVRDLRGRPEGVPDLDFRTFPLDYGSPLMHRLLAEAAPYDIVLNFAALKHVRSEKDVYSLLQMIDVNIVRHRRFKEWLARFGHGRVYFAVSTDKAANPTSLMGASKRLMEDIVFDVAADHGLSSTSARFANVAFSNGSLLTSFLQRLERRQPIALPRRTQRYFVSRREAGELCLLASFAVPARHIAFPRLDPTLELQYLEDVAVRILAALGLEPVFFDEERAARSELPALSVTGRWPVLITPLDTSGEKAYEEFLGENELAVDVGLAAVSTVLHHSTGAAEAGLFDRLAALVEDPGARIDKSDIVAMIEPLLPNFRHVETFRSLDQRL